MNCLDSMRRGRGKKGGDGKFEALRSLHGKLKIVEIKSHRCYGNEEEKKKLSLEYNEMLKRGEILWRQIQE